MKSYRKLTAEVSPGCRVLGGNGGLPRTCLCAECKDRWMSLVRDNVNAKIFLDNSGPQNAQKVVFLVTGVLELNFNSSEKNMSSKTRGIVSWANRKLIRASSCQSLVLANSYLTQVSS